jgi:PAS domain S-box-containing protein
MSKPLRAVTPSARLLAVDLARRRLVVQGVAGALAVLSLCSILMMLPLHVPALTLASSVGAFLGFCAVFWLARRLPPSPWAGPLLLGTMQIQHVSSALSLADVVHVADTIMYSGMIPLIAAVSVRVRGTVLATLAAFTGLCIVIGAQLQRGLPAEVVMRALGAPLFFVLMAGVVGTWTALAAERSLREQSADEAAKAEAQAAAEAAEQRFRVIADQVSDLVAVLDRKGDYTFASASYTHILSREPATLLGQSSRELLHPDDFDASAQAFQAALHAQPSEVVSRLRTADGSYRTFHLRMTGVAVDLSDVREHVAVTARDITLLQSSAAAAEAARRMDALGRLAGGVAHDFNNLLAVMGGCSAIVGASLPSDHRSQADLKVIDDAVRQAAALTGHLLSFARRQVLTGGQTTPSDALLEMAPLLQRAVGAHVSLEIDVSESTWTTAIHSGQLEQIVMNLAVNARDAMPEGGHLRIRVIDRALGAGEVAALAAGDHILVEVGDDGIGMAPEVYARIFEPFYTTKQPGRGTGLGLATSFGAARQVGGTLTVESELGVGTTMRLYMPRAAELSTQAPVLPARAQQPRTEHLKVLVVDDEPRICELVARWLESAGHHVLTASSSEGALANARTEVFDAIVTDVILNREDGLDVLEELRRLQPRAKAVVMSGFAPSPDRLAALRETGIGFLPKPFSLPDLLQALDCAIESTHA